MTKPQIPIFGCPFPGTFVEAFFFNRSGSKQETEPFELFEQSKFNMKFLDSSVNVLSLAGWQD